MEAFLEFLIVNIPFWVALDLLIFRVYKASKRGMVSEICTLIATVAGCIVVIAIAFAVRNFINQDKVIFVITIFLIAIFGLVYKLFTGLLESIKLVSKLPVVSILDKILGSLLGVFEVVMFVWMLYCVVLIMNAGIIEECVLNCVKANVVMRFLYDHNLIYDFIAPLSESIAELYNESLTIL